MSELVIAPDLARLQALAAEQITDLLSTTVATHGRALLAISGGSAPPGVFAHLCAEPLRGRMPWAALSLIWADERVVPFDHPDSNYRQARQSLLDHVPIPSAQVYPVATYLGGPQAAAIYERQVAALLEAHGGRIDLALLGMGPDGHTASLFPGFPQLLAPPEALALAVEGAPKPPPSRVTLTSHALNRASQVILLVAGVDKAATVCAALHEQGDPLSLPVRLVRPPAGHVRWMLDAAAAAHL